MRGQICFNRLLNHSNNGRYVTVGFPRPNLYLVQVDLVMSLICSCRLFLDFFGGGGVE